MGTWLRRSTSKNKYVFKHDNETMEQILEGLFNSDQADKFKEAFVNRVCEEGTQGSNLENTIKCVLQVSSRWILNGTTELQVISGFRLFKTWGCHNFDNFLLFFTPNMVAEMLIHGYGGMAANVPLLLREGFRVMQQVGNRLDPEHVKVVQSNITKFVSKAQERVVVRNVGLLIEEFADCLPQNENEKTNFCLAVIHHLSVGVPSEKGEEIQKFIRNTDEIGKFLSKLWTLQSISLFRSCLTTIFNIISASRTDETSDPAICLATVIKYIPIEMANTVVKEMVTGKSTTDESIEAAVSQIVEWLKWPTAQNVDLWLLCFLSELSVAHKYSLLVRIIETSTEQITENLAYHQLRYPSFKVLSHMLLGFQHSPGPFHKCLEKMPIIVHELRCEGTPKSGAFLKELSVLIYELMYQHTGFPELYGPIIDIIKDIPQPSIDEIKTKLNQISWLSQVNSMNIMESAASSHIVTAVRQEKLELGKTGLENLGNTCYMNSVIQALYMCDQFRCGVISKIPKGNDGLLVNLQHVFAQLNQSSRPTIAPSNLLQASRPPWFLPGHQQDCSEFLKYLLDQLHEEEKSSTSYFNMKRSPSSGSMSPKSPNPSVKMNTGTLSKTERKKATVMLTSLKMKRDEEVHDLSPVGSGSSDADKSSDSTLSLVERIFRGKVQTTLRCLACKQKSTRVESFADIPLAFPNSSRSTEYPQKNLAGGNSVPCADVTADSVQSEVTNEKESPKVSEADFSLNDLISYYLKPEKLTGDNKYHCNQCGKLQDGERSIQIIECPQYLILTLLRFSYDTKLQSRTKIFQDVHYPRTLSLPVCEESSSKNTKEDLLKQHSKNNSKPISRNDSVTEDSYQAKLEDIAKRLAPPCENLSQGFKSSYLYGLSGVIVHSGASSECGHYYCYARHSQAGQVDTNLLDKAYDNLDNLDLLPNKWYNFNDSRVSHTTFDSFSNVTKKFTKDTVYVLIYRKLGFSSQGFGLSTEVTLRPDLKDAVSRDNEAYLKEQELETRAREEQRRRRSSSVNSAHLTHWNSKDDDDNDNPNGGPPVYTDDGLDDGVSRFVF